MEYGMFDGKRAFIAPKENREFVFQREKDDSEAFRVLKREGLGTYVDIGLLVDRQPEVITEQQSTNTVYVVSELGTMYMVFDTNVSLDEAKTLDLFNAFTEFKKDAPDYCLGLSVSAQSIQSNEAAMFAFDCLIFSIMLQKHKDVTIATAKAERMLEWLHSTDFFTAPGSTVYHDSEVGGLLKHSLRVYNRMLPLLKLPAFSSIDLVDAAYACLVHDFCKIDSYESYSKNVKNEQTGQWEKVLAFKKKKYRGVPLPHGTASLFYAQKFYPVSTGMACAIVHHMGKWNTANSDDDALQQSNERYQLVHALQWADQLSIVQYT